MREIKFRGKRIDNGKWVYGDYTNNRFDEPSIWEDGYRIEIDHSTVGQYTGLKDKNGVEIYEGDYIQWSEMQPTYHDHDTEELATENYKVIFINGMFVAECLETRFPKFELLTEFKLMDCVLKEIEVIGNIHDNNI